MCPATVLQGRCEGALSLAMGSKGVVVIDARSGEVRAQLQERKVLSPLTTTDGSTRRSIPCSRPSRYDQVGRGGVTS
jgi:hypothetical protein